MEPRPRLLVCDDSPAHRMIIQTMLGEEFDFLLCESAEEALVRAPGFHPDVIISDLVMGGIDGFELCRRVRGDPLLAATPFILVTSRADESARLVGLEAGADEYLYKPIRRRELVARVRALVRLRRAVTALEEANRALQRTQADLLRAEKLASLGQLVAGVAHELNNPLNLICGNLGFLDDYSRALVKIVDGDATLPGLSDEQRAALARLREEADYAYVREDLGKLLVGARTGAERATGIIRGLRDFARAESAGLILEDVELERVIDMALTVLRADLRDRVRVERDLQPGVRVRGDSGRLAHVLIHLLRNAVQAMDGVGDLKITLSADERAARVAVRDSGCGMTPEVQARAFDPFFTTRAVGDGAGLGLSISFGIVNQHGGGIEVDSTPGKGSTFTVVLPVAGPPAALAGLPVH